MFQIEVKGLDALTRKLEAYANNLEMKKKTFLERLAEIGANYAEISFSEAAYDGEKDVTVPPPQWVDENTIAVVAYGQTVLFIEFGAGLIGGGHELAGQFGYGPGTWSDGPEGKHHWDDPRGWYYGHGKKSYGNRPARAMYEASKEMRENIIKIAREVFL